jgi:hypothetical protein
MFGDGFNPAAHTHLLTLHGMESLLEYNSLIIVQRFAPATDLAGHCPLTR